MSGRSPKKSDNTRYYEILEVSKSSSLDVLKKAYKKAAMKNHPDKGGDPEKFKEISRAYEVLSDPEKRKIYDEYGEDEFNLGMGRSGGIHDAFDIYQSLFGGNLFGGGSRRKRIGKNVIHPLNVSLEDLYLGTSKKLSVSRNVICSACNGKGSKSGASVKCSVCQGTGMEVIISYIGQSMIKQNQSCNKCNGSGETVKDNDRCTQCKGKKVVAEKKELEVIVEKGMQNGQKITFPGEADEAPDTITGGIVFVVQQKKHPKFERKGDDLFVEHILSISEALCGFQIVLVHLDGRQLLIKTDPGEVVKPDSSKVINDEGMPVYQNSFLKGKLYIHLAVDFPDSVRSEQMKVFEAIFPSKPVTEMTDMELNESELTTLRDISIADEMRLKQLDKDEAIDEGEEKLGRAQKLTCAQQ